MKKKLTRAACYHRVSSADQDPELAREELRAAARQRGCAIVLDVEETGSGARNSRPGLRRVMEAVQRGDVDAVLVWKLDRFGRSAVDLLTNVQALTSAGVDFIAVSQGLHVSRDGDAMSNLLLQMLAAFAEFERTLIRERTRLGLDKARAAGKQLGRPVTGPDPRAVAEARQDGSTWKAIAKRFKCTTSAVRRAAARVAVSG